MSDSTKHLHNEGDPENAPLDTNNMGAADGTDSADAFLQNSKGEGESPSHAKILVNLALASAIEFFHSPEGDAYVTMRVAGQTWLHNETWPVDSKTTRLWLQQRFFEKINKPVSSQAVEEAINYLKGRALFKGPEHPVFVRIAEYDGAIYVDLGDESWIPVEIKASGWTRRVNPPVRFVRYKGMQPLPEPVRGGTLDELRDLLNADQDDAWSLMVSWLIAAYHPTGPFPVLDLTGGKGSGKTTNARMLRGLVDPHASPLKTLPRSERDLMIHALHNRVLAFDNLSSVPGWLSDALCRLSTGGGFTVRKNYSDLDEIIMEAKRPMILTGIDYVPERDDLQERSFIVTLPKIEDRRTERELWEAYEEARPRILSAVFDAVSAALRNRDKVSLNLPRMADAAEWIQAAEEVFPWAEGTFAKTLETNHEESIKEILNSNPIVRRLRVFMKGKEEWKGTATELRSALSNVFITQRIGQLPAAHVLSRRLRSLEADLHLVSGIEMMFDLREGENGDRKIRIRNGVLSKAA